jgi:hypothetical protein
MSLFFGRQGRRQAVKAFGQPPGSSLRYEGSGRGGVRKYISICVYTYGVL